MGGSAREKKSVQSGTGFDNNWQLLLGFDLQAFERQQMFFARSHLEVFGCLEIQCIHNPRIIQAVPVLSNCKAEPFDSTHLMQAV